MHADTELHRTTIYFDADVWQHAVDIAHAESNRHQRVTASEVIRDIVSGKRPPITVKDTEHDNNTPC